MARETRIDDPGALHHIIVRGVEHRSIFVDAQDYQDFLERLGPILTDSSTSGYFKIRSDEIESQSRRKTVTRSLAGIRIIAIEQMGFSGADVARVLNITPSAVSKLVLRARNDPALRDGINDVLICFNNPCLR